MGKFITLLFIASIAVKAFSGRWPWQWWAVSEQSQQEAQARALLGVERGASRDQITEAHRRMLARVHPDRGGSADQVHAAAQARDLLLAGLDRSE